MSTSRDTIFKKLKKFQSNDKLEIQTFESSYEDIIETFIQNATLAGAVVYSEQEDIEKFNQTIPTDSYTYNSNLAVAENGALWCQNLGNDRHKLFSTNTLVITIKKADIVANMHNAYEKIKLSNLSFGTFIAGPSKTADIEQSLVIGAHGAMALFIILN